MLSYADDQCLQICLEASKVTLFEHEYKEVRYAELFSEQAFELAESDVGAWAVRYSFGADAKAPIVPTRAGADLEEVVAPAGLTVFASSNSNLDRVFELAPYTNVGGSLDVHAAEQQRYRGWLGRFQGRHGVHSAPRDSARRQP